LIAVGYAARKYGISRHDNAAVARRKCPGIILPHVELVDETGGVVESPESADRNKCKVSLARYRKASKLLFAEFLAVAGAACCEKASIDEAFLDVTDMCKHAVETGIIPETVS